MAKKRILVIDDDDIILDVIKDSLTMFGYDVVIFNNPEKALESFAKESFNLVLTDLSMEPINGLEIAKHIIGNYQKYPPIVIMTGYGSVESVIDAMKLGVKDYILKPFKIEHLVNVIKKVIKHKELENENLKLKEIIDIYSASEDINNSLEIDDVAFTFVKHLQNILRSDVVGLYINDDFNILKTKKDYFHVRKKIKDKKNEIFEKFPHKLHFKKIKDLLKDESWRYLFFDEKIDIGINLEYKSLIIYFLRVAQKDIGVVFVLNFDEPATSVLNKLMPLKILFDEGAIAIENAILYKKNRDMFLKTLQSLAIAIDAKDAYTHFHSTNVSRYSVFIAKKLKFTVKDIETISFGALLHDIGKIGIPENILNKPDKLTDEEFNKIKEHPTIGKGILNPIKEQFPEIMDMIYYHHERYDGKGYPEGIKGNDIPLKARIVSLADAFDAMTSDRAYRKKLDINFVVEEIRKNSGTQFDPIVVNAFFDALPEVKHSLRSVYKTNGE